MNKEEGRQSNILSYNAGYFAALLLIFKYLIDAHESKHVALYKGKH
jgi:hypothetical protein